jgi:hypothetical protein
MLGKYQPALISGQTVVDTYINTRKLIKKSREKTARETVKSQKT